MKPCGSPFDFSSLADSMKRHAGPTGSPRRRPGSDRPPDRVVKEKTSGLLDVASTVVGGPNRWFCDQTVELFCQGLPVRTNERSVAHGIGRPPSVHQAVWGWPCAAAPSMSLRRMRVNMSHGLPCELVRHENRTRAEHQFWQARPGRTSFLVYCNCLSFLEEAVMKNFANGCHASLFWNWSTACPAMFGSGLPRGRFRAMCGSIWFRRCSIWNHGSEQ